MTSDDLHETLRSVWLREISADDVFGNLKPVIHDANRLGKERDRLAKKNERLRSKLSEVAGHPPEAGGDDE